MRRTDFTASLILIKFLIQGVIQGLDIVLIFIVFLTKGSTC
jgi:hypothetical protein